MQPPLNKLMIKLEISCNFPENTTYSPTDEEKTEFRKEELIIKLEKLGLINIKIENLTNRTLTFNRAFHLFLKKIEIWCYDNGLTADILIFRENEREKWENKVFVKFGLNVKDFVFKEMLPNLLKTEMPITANLLKDYFREIGNYMFSKKSTRDLTNAEMCQVLEVFKGIVAGRLGYNGNFPSREELYFEELK